MNDKKCPVCGCDVDETISVCPECGAELTASQAETEDMEVAVEEAVVEEAAEPQTVADENAEAADESIDPEEASEDIQPAPKASKGIKILCAVMAVLLVVAAGGYWWYNNNKDTVFDVSSFGTDDLNGRFLSDTIGMYFEFDATEVTADIAVEVPAEESADSAAASDAQEPQFVTEERTFDGSFENGYTEEYINKVLMSEYINKNELTEEFTSFVEENNLTDGVEEYISFKGIKQEDIDAMEGAQELRDQGASYTETGYWDYDEAKKEVVIYNGGGTKLLTLLVKKEGLVADVSFMAGKTKKNSTFNSSLVLRAEDYGVTQTMTTYEDGNLLIKVDYDDGQNGESVGGTYEVKDGKFIMEVNGNKVTYSILNDGIAGEIYTK